VRPTTCQTFTLSELCSTNLEKKFRGEGELGQHWYRSRSSSRRRALSVAAYRSPLCWPGTPHVEQKYTPGAKGLLIADGLQALGPRLPSSSRECCRDVPALLIDLHMHIYSKFLHPREHTRSAAALRLVGGPTRTQSNHAPKVSSPPSKSFCISQLTWAHMSDYTRTETSHTCMQLSPGPQAATAATPFSHRWDNSYVHKQPCEIRLIIN
jgi:hypothetical protein